MTMNLISFTIVTAILLAVFGMPAHAGIIEAHDAWAMTCFPVDGPPFRVAVSNSQQLLAIRGQNGVIRSSHILDNRQDGQGFTVIARGADRNGYTRHLQVHFGPDNGWLDVIDRREPVINCGPDQGISHD